MNCNWLSKGSALGMKNNDIEMARKIATKVADAGGRVYFVGGYVRDQLLNRENKDIDIEVHSVSVGKLEEILDSLGNRTVMGASFGVFGLSHYDLDIAMPRTERSTGMGHKDFTVSVDPFIGPQKAAERRDFTMNALMQDVLTGEILDFFDGKSDLSKKRIRHVVASLVKFDLREIEEREELMNRIEQLIPSSDPIAKIIFMRFLEKNTIEGRV